MDYFLINVRFTEGCEKVYAEDEQTRQRLTGAAGKGPDGTVAAQLFKDLRGKKGANGKGAAWITSYYGADGDLKSFEGYKTIESDSQEGKPYEIRRHWLRQMPIPIGSRNTKAWKNLQRI